MEFSAKVGEKIKNVTGNKKNKKRMNWALFVMYLIKLRRKFYLTDFYIFFPLLGKKTRGGKNEIFLAKKKKGILWRIYTPVLGWNVRGNEWVKRVKIRK